MSTEKSPSDQVEVTLDVGDPAYPSLVESLYGSDPVAVDWWIDLGDLLGGRPGWRCCLGDGGITWRFGPLDTSLFSISAPDEEDDESYDARRYVVHDHAPDDIDVECVGASVLLGWLEGNEPRHAEHLTSLRPLMSGHEWDVLTMRPFDVRITHDDLTFIATVPTVSPMDAAFGNSLGEVLANARAMIAAACGAPAEVTDRLNLKARLDAKATRAVLAAVTE